MTAVSRHLTRSDDITEWSSRFDSLHVGMESNIVIPSNGLVLVRELCENPHPPIYIDTNKTGRNRINKRLRISVLGCVSMWVPVGASLVGSNRLSRLQNDSTGMCYFYSRFDGTHCKLSATPMRMLTGFELHNINGSDEGALTAIATTLWMASTEMGEKR